MSIGVVLLERIYTDKYKNCLPTGHGMDTAKNEAAIYKGLSGIVGVFDSPVSQILRDCRKACNPFVYAILRVLEFSEKRKHIYDF